MPHLPCLSQLLIGDGNVSKFSSSLGIDLLGEHKVLSPQALSPCFLYLINLNGFGMYYQYVDLGFLITSLSFKAICLTANLLLEEIIWLFLGFIMYLKKKWLHTSGFKMISTGNSFSVENQISHRAAFSFFVTKFSDLITLLPSHFVLFKCNNTNITNLVFPNPFAHSLSTMILSAIKI